MPLPAGLILIGDGTAVAGWTMLTATNRLVAFWSDTAAPSSALHHHAATSTHGHADISGTHGHPVNLIAGDHWNATFAGGPVTDAALDHAHSTSGVVDFLSGATVVDVTTILDEQNAVPVNVSSRLYAADMAILRIPVELVFLADAVVTGISAFSSLQDVFIVNGTLAGAVTHAHSVLDHSATHSGFDHIHGGVASGASDNATASGVSVGSYYQTVYTHPTYSHLHSYYVDSPTGSTAADVTTTATGSSDTLYNKTLVNRIEFMPLKANVAGQLPKAGLIGLWPNGSSVPSGWTALSFEASNHLLYVHGAANGSAIAATADHASFSVTHAHEATGNHTHVVTGDVSSDPDNLGDPGSDATPLMADVGFSGHFVSVGTTADFVLETATDTAWAALDDADNAWFVPYQGFQFIKKDADDAIFATLTLDAPSYAPSSSVTLTWTPGNIGDTVDILEDVGAGFVVVDTAQADSGPYAATSRATAGTQTWRVRYSTFTDEYITSATMDVFDEHIETNQATYEVGQTVTVAWAWHDPAATVDVQESVNGGAWATIAGGGAVHSNNATAAGNTFGYTNAYTVGDSVVVRVLSGADNMEAVAFTIIPTVIPPTGTTVLIEDEMVW